MERLFIGSDGHWYAWPPDTPAGSAPLALPQNRRHIVATPDGALRVQVEGQPLQHCAGPRPSVDGCAWVGWQEVLTGKQRVINQSGETVAFRVPNIGWYYPLDNDRVLSQYPLGHEIEGSDLAALLADARASNDHTAGVIQREEQKAASLRRAPASGQSQEE